MTRAVAPWGTLSPSRVDLEQGVAGRPYLSKKCRYHGDLSGVIRKGLVSQPAKGLCHARIKGAQGRGRSWLEWFGNVNMREGPALVHAGTKKARGRHPRTLWTLISVVQFAFKKSLGNHVCKSCFLFEKILNYCLFVHPISWESQYKLYSSIYQIERHQSNIRQDGRGLFNPLQWLQCMIENCLRPPVNWL